MSIRKSVLYTFAISLGLLSATAVFAWTGPSVGFSGGNASAPLNVSNSGQIKSGVLTAGGLSAPVFCIGVSCISSWSAAGASQWTTNGSNIYYNAGSVGIGVANPSGGVQLDVRNSVDSTVIQIVGPTHTVDILETGAGGMLKTVTNGTLSFGTNNVTRMTIDAAGNVGIGTPNPTNALSVEKDQNAPTRVDVTNTTAGASSYSGFGVYNDLGVAGAILINSSANTTNYGGASSFNLVGTLSAPMTFLTTNVERMRISAAGNVGIGTTNPSQKLDIYSTNQVALYAHSDSSYGIFGHSGTSWGGVITQDGGTLGLVVERTDGAIYSELMASGYGLLTNQPVQAPAFYYSSDERLKKNIAAIASSTALEDILALQPVTFNWINPTQPTTTQLGFIAQQVEKVVPELVITNASTTMKAVDYARVAPLLVGAAQAQQAQIDAQQKEIDELKAEVAVLKAGR